MEVKKRPQKKHRKFDGWCLARWRSCGGRAEGGESKTPGSGGSVLIPKRLHHGVMGRIQMPAATPPPCLDRVTTASKQPTENIKQSASPSIFLYSSFIIFVHCLAHFWYLFGTLGLSFRHLLVPLGFLLAPLGSLFMPVCPKSEK